MGWTETRAMHRKANGKPDVKAELDAIYEWSDQIHTSKVLKSRLFAASSVSRFTMRPLNVKNSPTTLPCARTAPMVGRSTARLC